MNRLSKLSALLALATGVLSTAYSANETASRVTNERTEESLTTVTLTEKAEDRLAIEVVPIKKMAISLSRSYPGEVVFPIPNSLNGLPTLSSHTPEAMRELITKQIEADAAIKTADQRVAYSKSHYEQIQAMLSRKVVSQIEVERSKLALEEARIALDTARQNRTLLGDSLATGTPSENRFWVKTSIFAGDFEKLELNSNAKLRTLDGDNGETDATPIPNLRTANATQASIDVYYEVPFSRTLIPGLRVQIDIPLKIKQESLVIPWSAVLFDIYGNQWVYERIAPQTYTRRSVQVQRVANDLAVLAAGPPIASPIVTAGAAELMGTEFGVGH